MSHIYSPGHSRKTNLYYNIWASVPTAVCQLVKVKTGDIQIPSDVITANMSAIREAWVAARQAGLATLTYDRFHNSFHLSYNRSSNTELVGQVSLGLMEDPTNRSDYNTTYTNRTDYHFYGTVDHLFKVFYPLISCEAESLIVDYYRILKIYKDRIAQSYEKSIILGGIDTNKAPLLKAVQEKIVGDTKKGEVPLLPEKSKVSVSGVSLAEMDKAIKPFQEAICTEVNVPMWLLFPVEPLSTSFALEERDNWLTNQFTNNVYLPLLEILTAQGYKSISIETPNYRDEKYKTDISGTRADINYKEAATYRLGQAGTQTELANIDNLLGIDSSGSVGKVNTGRSL